VLNDGPGACERPEQEPCRLCYRMVLVCVALYARFCQHSVRITAVYRSTYANTVQCTSPAIYPSFIDSSHIDRLLFSCIFKGTWHRYAFLIFSHNNKILLVQSCEKLRFAV